LKLELRPVSWSRSLEPSFKSQLAAETGVNWSRRLEPNWSRAGRKTELRLKRSLGGKTKELWKRFEGTVKETGADFGPSFETEL